MLISIVIPTFNSERYLPDALDSMIRSIAGSPADCEIIVCDKNSTDSTLDIVTRYRDLVDIKVYSSQDSGVPDALNRGFARARGDIVGWLNSDDLLLASDLIKLFSQVFGDRHTDAVVFDSVVVDIEGVVQHYLRSWVPTPTDYVIGSNIFTGSLFFKKSVFERFGGFSGKYHIAFEYELISWLLCHAKVETCPHLVGGFRNNPDGIGKARRYQMDAERVAILGPRGPRTLKSLFRRALEELRGDSPLGILRRRMPWRYRGIHWRDIKGSSI